MSRSQQAVIQKPCEYNIFITIGPSVTKIMSQMYLGLDTYWLGFRVKRSKVKGHSRRRHDGRLQPVKFCLVLLYFCFVVLWQNQRGECVHWWEGRCLFCSWWIGAKYRVWAVHRCIWTDGCDWSVAVCFDHCVMLADTTLSVETLGPQCLLVVFRCSGPHVGCTFQQLAVLRNFYFHLDGICLHDVSQWSAASQETVKWRFNASGKCFS